jgi:hypothetical protein
VATLTVLITNGGNDDVDADDVFTYVDNRPQVSLYDPAGKRFVTNGGHTDEPADEKQLLFPHHRGFKFS